MVSRRELISERSQGCRKGSQRQRPPLAERSTRQVEGPTPHRELRRAQRCVGAGPELDRIEWGLDGEALPLSLLLDRSVVPLDIQAELKAARRQLMRTCQHPQAAKGVCNRIIDAHTVPRSSLSRFAEAGHVMQLNFWDPSAGLRGDTGKIEAHPRGINEASTLPIFCGKHDKAVFSSIEEGDVEATEHHALLFHYRAAVRQFVNREYARRGYLRVWGKTGELPGPMRMTFRVRVASEALDALRNAERAALYKLHCDHLLETKSTRGVRAVFVEFEELPHFMCCGVFDPLFDFAGNSLQKLAHPLARSAAPIDPVALTVVGTERGGLAVLSSVGFGLAAERFLASFAALPDRDKSDALTRLAYNVVENVYLSPSWWNAMGTDSQADFVEAANARYGVRLPDDVLASAEPRLANWMVSSVRQVRGWI
jgi:hypothetical protein